jgi:hypothetical protein
MKFLDLEPCHEDYGYDELNTFWSEFIFFIEIVKELGIMCL